MASDAFLEIGFPSLSPAAASKAAAEMEALVNQTLREEGLKATARQTRTDPSAGDLGIILSIVLGAPATIVLARGIASGIQKYLARTNRGRVSITRKDGTVIEVTDTDSRDMAKIVSAIGVDGTS
jgi:hypothetical protein